MRVFVVDGLSVEMFPTEQEAKDRVAALGKDLPVILHHDDLAFVSLSELGTLHNKIAEALGYKPLKGFKDKPTAIRRVFSVMNDLADATLGEGDIADAVEAAAPATAGNKKKKPKKKPGTKTPMPNKGPKKKAEIYDDESLIRVLSEKNPKREGTKAFDKFAVFKDGMTVTQALAAGNELHPEFGKNWVRSELNWCIQRNYLRLDPPASAAVAA